MSEGKRIRRTPEQIVADLDVQIENLKDSILELVIWGAARPQTPVVPF